MCARGGISARGSGQLIEIQTVLSSLRFRSAIVVADDVEQSLIDEAVNDSSSLTFRDTYFLGNRTDRRVKALAFVIAPVGQRQERELFRSASLIVEPNKARRAD